MKILNPTIKKLIAISVFLPYLSLAMPTHSIEFSGLTSITRGTALSYMPIEVGDEYGHNTAEEIEGSLLKTGFFKEVKVLTSNGIIKVEVKENPHIKYIEMLNFSENVVESSRMNVILDSLNLSKGSIFDENKLDNFIKEIEANYISEGYYGSEITKRIAVDHQNRVGIEVSINEGDVAKIKSFDIVGHNLMKKGDLLDLFTIGEPDFFLLNYFTEKDSFSKRELEAGLSSMKSEYLNRGYLDFEVMEAEVKLSDDKKRIDIEIKINEGSEYKVGNIKFKGDLLDYSTKYLRKKLSFTSGETFNRKKVVEGVYSINDIFTEKGYAFSDITIDTSERKSSNQIDIDINVELNQKVYIDRITIVGNTRTQDEVIRREIGVNEGELYSSKQINESVKKIKRLGFFSNVKMDIVKIEGSDDRVNLHFTVKETNTGAFSVGVSHSNSTGTGFNIGVEERNFLGTGNVLNAKLSSSKAVKELDIYFSNPYFTKDKHSISYGIFSKDVDGSNLSISSYETNEVGVMLGYGIPLTEDTRVESGLRLSSKDINCGEMLMVEEPNQCINPDKNEVSLKLAWSNNTLDSMNFPTEGNKNEVSVNVALPIADFKYYKIDVSHKSYYPLSEDLTLKINGDIGLAQGYGGKELPFFKRYYGGGNSSVRGFDFNSLGKTYTGTNNAKGGELSLLASTSIISPMSFVSDSDNMRMSAFVDVGSIEEKVEDLSFDELRVSAGVAFSWITPIGPLGIHIAKPLVKKATDRTNSISFTLGTSF